MLDSLAHWLRVAGTPGLVLLLDISRYAITPDGELLLEDAVAATAVDGVPGLRDEDLSADGRFLTSVRHVRLL